MTPTAREKPQRGRVLAVGPGVRDEDGKRIEMDLLEIEQPMIAAINGPCTIHAEQLLLCDIVLAADYTDHGGNSDPVGGGANLLSSHPRTYNLPSSGALV